MEEFTFGLKLVDSVSQPGKRAVDALRQVEAQAKRTQAAVSGKELGGLAKQLGQVGMAAAREQKKQADAFGKMWEKVGLSAARAQHRAAQAADRSRQRMYDKAYERAGNRQAMGESMGFGKLTSAAFLGSALANVATHIVGGMIDGAKRAVDIFTDGLKSAFEEGAKEQTLQLGERLSLGAKGAQEFRDDAGRFSKLTGFGDDTIRRMLLPMRRAGMNQGGARTAFAAAGDIAAGEGQGGNAGRVQELLGVFTKIQQRGGVDEKGLLNMGLNVKDFYAALGKELKVSSKEAKSRAESGSLDPQLLLNTVYKGIEKAQGAKLGSGMAQYSQTFESRMAALKSKWNDFAKTILKSPLFARTTALLGQLLERLDPDSPTGKRIQASLDSMFEKISSLIGDPADTAQKLAEGIETAIDVTTQLVTVAAELADAFLPSLDTIEDMVLAFREMKAFGNAAATKEVDAERGRVNQKRINRAADKLVKEATPGIFAAKVQNALTEETFNQSVAADFGGPLGLNPLGLGIALSNASGATTQAQNDLGRARGSSRQQTINIPKIELNFHGSVDEDTARKVADATHVATTNALEGAQVAAY